MATSGTVGTVTYPIRKIMDHAFMRAGYEVQKITSEGMTIAFDLLYSLCTDIVNAGFPLWTRQYVLLSVTNGSPDVRTPQGTVDVLQSYWRSFQPYRGACTLSSGAPNDTLFSGEAESDTLITGPDPGVIVDFSNDTVVNTVGILLGGAANVTASLLVETSSDGSSWTTSQSLPSTTFQPGVWSYFDLNPVTTSRFLQVSRPGVGDLTLNHVQFCFAGGVDTPLGVNNIDDYFTLPSKQQLADRPVTAYVDRQVDVPVLKVWGVPNTAAFYGGTVTASLRRYIMDPGTLQNELEVPRRWIEAIQWSLAEKILAEVPASILLGQQVEITLAKLQERKQRLELAERKGKEHRMLAWTEERTKGPIRITPNIGPYTV